MGRILRKYKLKRIGTVLAILVVGAVSFTSGINFADKANGESSLSVLQVNRGGTGAGSFTAGQALIGNDASKLTSLGIDTAPASGSKNLITSGALDTINQKALSASGAGNFYKTLEGTTDVGGNEIYILGEVPTQSGSSGQYTNLEA
ncbi:MAG: hypothetical protein LBB07_00005, partial [Bifidobacteriaceae bacterium]|nr:hypothetical protein [Bifidobacteriaceae bacterium]